MLNTNQFDITDQRVRQAYETFQALISLAENFINKRQYSISSVCAQIASQYAVFHHPGVFASSRLENILLTIGQRVIQPGSYAAKRIDRDKFPEQVVHILTSVNSIGGHTRYVLRWIQEDVRRRHSVILTRLRDMEVPTPLSEAVSRSGGDLHILDMHLKDPIILAQALREIAERADLLVLHIFPDDIVPLMAFAIKGNLPPLIFVDHADHMFWLGVHVCDAVVHLRKAGLRLGTMRRGIDRKRAVLLPTPLGQVHRTNSQAWAKAQLGFADDTVLIVSVARAFKYLSIGGPSFVEIVEPIITKYKNSILLVVGPDNRDQWQKGNSKTYGRIKAFGERPDPTIFYEAADIYIDSFPFASITSLLEAGSYGLPLVSYCPHPREAEVLCAGAVGLSNSLQCVKNVPDFHLTLSKLIEDKDLRLRIGEQTKTDISCTHVGNGWRQALREMYLQVARIYPMTRQLVEEKMVGVNQEAISNLDVLVNRLYSRQSVGLGAIIDSSAGLLPYGLRFKLLLRMLRMTKSFSFGLFLPGWLERKIQGRLSWWRRIPGIARHLRIGS